ncbi:MAG: hypothetical protein CM15mP76_13410 [Prochlorococcus sp.]|nr:MAG: hypothetical protein CM15mP76_13410 [Prochlorococcus sp.]
MRVLIYQNLKLYKDNIYFGIRLNIFLKKIYGAEDIIADKKIKISLKKFENDGFGSYPKLHGKNSIQFSTDPFLMGLPTGHGTNKRSKKLSAGAEFIVVGCGEIMTMPGLPKVPALRLLVWMKIMKCWGDFKKILIKINFVII